MLPRLTAEESITAANRTAVGTGSLDKAGRKAVTDEWIEAIEAHRTKGPRAPSGPTPDQLSRFSIGSRKVKKPKPTEAPVGG